MQRCAIQIHVLYALSVLCAQPTRDLLAIAKFLLLAFRLFGRFYAIWSSCGHHGDEYSTTECRARWVGLGRVQSFMLILDWVGLVTSLVGRVGSGQEYWTHVKLCT